MFRALAAALFLSCCAPLSSDAADPFLSGGGSDVYTVEAHVHDYDVKTLRVYCNGSQALVMRGLSMGEVRTNRLRDSSCSHIRFVSIGLTSEVLYRSPELAVPPGATLRITLPQHPRGTRWTWRKQSTDGR